MNREINKSASHCLCQTGITITPENEKLFYLLRVLNDMYSKEFTGQLMVKFTRGGVRRIETIPGT